MHILLKDFAHVQEIPSDDADSPRSSHSVGAGGVDVKLQRLGARSTKRARLDAEAAVTERSRSRSAQPQKVKGALIVSSSSSDIEQKHGHGSQVPPKLAKKQKEVSKGRAPKKSKKKTKKKKHKKNKKAKSRKKGKQGSSTSSSSSSLSVGDVPQEFKDAVEYGSKFLAQHLLTKFGLSWCDESGDGPLHVAAKQNRIDLVAWILARPGAGDVLDLRNTHGETPLLVAVRLQRSTIALRLLEALADPGTADAGGQTPESLDLDGLLQEAEQSEKYSRTAEYDRVLSAVAVARRSREESEWRERLFFETGMDDFEPFSGYEDLEHQDAWSSGRNWMDEIALEVEQRRRQEARSRAVQREQAAHRKREQARAEAEAQEAKARAAAKQAQAGKLPHVNTQGSPASSVQPPTKAQQALDSEEVRIAARAKDDARWRVFEEKVASLTAKSATAAVELRAKDIPWPSGPPENPVLIDSSGHPAVVRSQLRASLLRWHPDKFAQRVGRLLPAEGAERDRAVDRVKEIAQQLNALMAKITSVPSITTGGTGTRSGSTASAA